MLESIAITVAPALAVVELKGRAEGRRADASTYETSATGSHDVSGGTSCRIVVLGGAVAARTARVICPPGKSLSGAAGRRAPRPPPRGGCRRQAPA